MAQGAQMGRPRRGIDQGANLHAGPQVLPGEQVEQRTASGQHHGVARQRTRALEHDLPGPRPHHAGQSPALDGKGPLHGSAGQQHELAGDLLRPALRDIVHHARRADVPHGRAADMTGSAVTECGGQALAGGIVLAEQFLQWRRGGRDTAVDLPARLVLLVEHHHRQAQRTRLAGRRHARRAAADDDQVCADVTHGLLLRLRCPAPEHPTGA